MLILGSYFYIMHIRIFVFLFLIGVRRREDHLQKAKIWRVNFKLLSEMSRYADQDALVFLKGLDTEIHYNSCQEKDAWEYEDFGDFLKKKNPFF